MINSDFLPRLPSTEVSVLVRIISTNDDRKSIVENLIQVMGDVTLVDLLDIIENSDPSEDKYRVIAIEQISFMGSRAEPKLIDMLFDAKVNITGKEIVKEILTSYFATPEALAAIDQWRREQGR